MLIHDKDDDIQLLSSVLILVTKNPGLALASQLVFNAKRLLITLLLINHNQKHKKNRCVRKEG